MVENNKGYTMVIVLVVIVVLFSLSAGLTILVNGEISQSSNNFERIKAKYNAETGIEEGIIELKYNMSSLEEPDPNEPSYVSNNDWVQGSYEYNIYKPGVLINTKMNQYMVKSTGYYRNKGDKKVTITVFLEKKGGDENFIYGNQFTINREDSLLNNNELDDLEEGNSALVEKDDLLEYFNGTPTFFNIDPRDLYREFIREYYFNDDSNENGIIDKGEDLEEGETEESYIQTPDEVAIIDSNSTTYYVDKQSNLTDADGNDVNFSVYKDPYKQMFHYRGDLTFEGTHPQQSDLDSEYNLKPSDVEDPNNIPTPLIIVDGDLIIDQIQAIRNFIFIVKGGVHYLSTDSANDSNIENTVIYSEGSFNYYRTIGDGSKDTSDTPNLVLNGQIITEKTINLKIKKNNEANNTGNIDWPPGFNPDSFGGFSDGIFKIAEWIE